MFAIIGAILFSFIALLTILVALGLPLGELTMGGQYKVLPKHLRIVAIISLLIQVFAIIIVLQAGGFLGLIFSKKITQYITLFFGIYLSLNTVMNFSSKSKKEKHFMTPLSLIGAICFFVTAFKI